MKPLSLDNFKSLLIYLLFFANFAYSEDEVDIWKKKNIKKNNSENIQEFNSNKNKNNNNINISNQMNVETIQMNSDTSEDFDQKKIFGLFDPDENNFNLNMWENSNGKEISEIIKRISKIELSDSAENMFTSTLMSYSYPPKNMSDEEFLELKINWLIKNKKDNLLENFLNKNENFYKKEKVIQYLVDKNIAKANLKDGCEKVNFISKEIKDAYLEKFKIYCLIFENKKNQAQLLNDILKEQGLSDKFFDDKINYLIGITKTTSQKVRDDNLLNFYLSSVTIKDFKYEPTEKTKTSIWEYLNSANLIQVDNLENKEKIVNLENAANNNTFDKEKVFDIYKKISFDLNTLIGAENLYQTFDGVESRALIYQRYLLSDKVENKIKLLILLKDLFKRDSLSNVFTLFLSDRLKEIDDEDIPGSYQQVVKNNIISEVDNKLGRIKYDDKVLHRSRVVRYYTEQGTSKQKTQKDLDNVYKKIKKNRKYFFSAKDLVLVEALVADGFKIPSDIKYSEISKKYAIPSNLLEISKSQEIGYLALKFVEIIGTDEISDLDPETIYFITNILNKAKLIKFRNNILISSLPLRS